MTTTKPDRSDGSMPWFCALSTMGCRNSEYTYIRNAFDYPFSNGFTESFNSAAKSLKRDAFGNFHNFRTRILHCSNFYPYN